MRIFLTGMMGSGKSFWGSKIAAKYKLPFYDLDVCIEKKIKKTLSEIFDEDGETFFRHLETAILQEIIGQHDHFLMATGGGTVCRPENIALMKSAGKMVYLKTDAATLISRLKKDKQLRPLLQNLSGEALEKKISSLLQERESFYEQSDIILNMNQIDERTFAEIFFQFYV